MGEPTPGSFSDEEETIPQENKKVIDRLRKLKETKVKPEIAESEVKQLNAFVKEFNPKSDLVYYPCCGQDVSPSQVFHNRVVYLDGNEHCVKALKKERYEAHQGDANTFDPGNVDIVIIYNPQMRPEPLLSHVKEGGYVICNNYHSTANAMNRLEQFEFLGAVDDKSGTINRENPDEYWQEVETDDQLLTADPVIGRYIKDTVMRLTGATDNILENYHKILADNPMGVVIHEEKHIALWSIPTKKTSGAYIFRKKMIKNEK